VTDDGWHIYWQNPGDSGEPPRIKWQLPSGVTATALEWPTPMRMTTSAGARLHDLTASAPASLLLCVLMTMTAHVGIQCEKGVHLLVETHLAVPCDDTHR
jgi:DsbC/DsbD-like thiol-disulfide interchange protein